MRLATTAFALFSLFASSCATPPANEPPRPGIRLETWGRGLALRSAQRPELAIYLWFYEWGLFEAVFDQQMSRGAHRWWRRSVDPHAARGEIDAEPAGMQLEMIAVDDGTELTLEVTNRSKHDWPELAAIVPCLNPGRNHEDDSPRTPHFANRKTFFPAADGLARLSHREIHFRADLRERVDALATPGPAARAFAWSRIWRTALPNAQWGLLIRESNDGRWVAGIGWEDALAVQGNNPWDCMHVAIRVGPLARGETKTLRGRIYLFEGTKEELLERFVSEFGSHARGHGPQPLGNSHAPVG